jgi:hypothetical protein
MIGRRLPALKQRRIRLISKEWSSESSNLHMKKSSQHVKNHHAHFRVFIVIQKNDWDLCCYVKVITNDGGKEDSVEDIDSFSCFHTASVLTHPLASRLKSS